ncbi:MAG TPA: hypothetical protein VK582_09270 [Pyrinomonadaceae bacterium]|nr:hypothetical protein [Pyrinomonadaceae bacterium]
MTFKKTDKYHDIKQPFRIQKRLVLNEAFRTIYRETGEIGRLTYVTFGGDNLWDVMDLVAVFGISSLNRMSVFSFERDSEKALASQSCPVATTLSKVETVSVNIKNSEFPVGCDELYSDHRDGRFIYFLDYPGTFAEKDAVSLTELLDAGLLLSGDFFLITSCLSPRIVHQSSFMERYRAAFGMFYTGAKIDREFKVRNHVDLLVATVFSRYQRKLKWLSREELSSATLLRKFMYRDSKATMGLWLFRVDSQAGTTRFLRDSEFEEFPYAFTKKEVEPDVPNIFD